MVRISFGIEAVKKLLCKEPTAFTLEGESFSSGEVRPYEFVTLCHFTPGEYEYTVRRRGQGPRGITQRSTGYISVTK